MIGIGHTQENGGCIASAPDKLAWPKDVASLDELSRDRCLRLFVSPLVFRRLVEVTPHPLKAANESLIKEGTPMPAKQKILLVEDHEDTSDLMVLILSQLDYDVATAASISGALGLADSTDFDLFVLDSMLPDGTGTDLCKHIRERNNSTPILFYSAMAFQHDKDEALTAGAQRYLVKPVDSDVFCRTVAAMLNGGATFS